MPILTFVQSLGLIILMELGDKTMLTTMCLSAQYRRPGLVLLATMTALVSSSMIAVILGFILSTTLPVEIITYISGILFFSLGIITLAKANNDIPDTCDNSGTLFGMFSLVLLSELGDKSQIAILALAAQSIYPIIIFLGSVFAFLIVNSIGAAAGNHAAERIPMKTIKILVGIVFILFGLLVILGII
ncbi:TMEM165/GDT1 family protein [Candidatus Thorarchaeota archaeon]|nr:MAG: TMEM165/GDT1 family protein [Candidatus Thorarchaeota archaeon]